jgi:Peptidase family M48
MSLRISRGASLAAVVTLVAGMTGCMQGGFDGDPATPQNADPNAPRQYGQQQQPGEDPQGAPGQQGQNGGPNQYGQPGQYGPNQAGPQGPYGQNGPPPGQYGPSDPYRPQSGPQQPQQQPQQYPPQQGPAGPPPGMGGGANPNDPITLGETQFLRNEASRVIVELINALPQNYKARVQDVPLNADPTVGEINAFAACDDAGKPLMAISDGLLQIEANVAAFRATDEIFGTRKLDAYLRMVATNYRPGKAIPRPNQGFVDANQASDPRKIARQHLLMDEQLAFVLGHELAHHYLGHTGCANGQGGSRARGEEIIRAGSRMAGKTALNQVVEAAADVAGTNNLLTAGSRRQGTKWSEEGAMLTFEFFTYMEPPTAANIFVAAFMTHAHPALRRPVVQQAATQWRATGGTGFQIPNGIQIPGFFGGG